MKSIYRIYGTHIAKKQRSILSLPNWSSSTFNMKCMLWQSYSSHYQNKKKSVCLALYYKINNTIRVLVLSLPTMPNLELLSAHSIMLNNKFHTQVPLYRHMNDGEDIHIDSYKESHLDSHQCNLVSDNVTKVPPTAP